MISSLPTYSVFILLSSEKEKKYVSKDKSNRKFRTAGIFLGWAQAVL